MNRKDELAATVIAVNKAHAFINETFPKLAEIFKPLVGTVICKNGGALLAKVEKLIPEMPYVDGLHVTCDNSTYAVRWTVQASETINGLAYYYTIGMTIGEKDCAVLKNLNDPPQYRDDYTLAEIQAKRAVVASTKKAYEDACGKCHPFKCE